MNYIYNNNRIVDLMMFHDRELSNGDIIWAYEPKRLNPAYNRLIDDIKWCYIGGKVIAKYRVVEVYDYYEEYTNNPFGKDTVLYKTRKQRGVSEFDMSEYNNKSYAYKLEKIEDVSMSLDQFYVASKFIKIVSQYTTKEITLNELIKEYDNHCTLTRYNGLTQVIVKEWDEWKSVLNANVKK